MPPDPRGGCPNQGFLRPAARILRPHGRDRSMSVADLRQARPVHVDPGQGGVEQPTQKGPLYWAGHTSTSWPFRSQPWYLPTRMLGWAVTLGGTPVRVQPEPFEDFASMFQSPPGVLR